MPKERNRSGNRSKDKGGFPLAWIFAAAAVLLIAGLGVLYVNGSGEGAGQIGPRLAVNQDRIDLGKQPFDKTVRAEFKITNSGDRTLTLDATTPVKALEGC